MQQQVPYEHEHSLISTFELNLLLVPISFFAACV